MKERDIVRQIRGYLAAQHVFHIRVGTGTFFMDGRAFHSHSLGAGTADILALPDDGRRVWIECKSENGKQRPSQRLFQEWVEELWNHQYVVAHSIDDLKAIGL